MSKKKKPTPALLTPPLKPAEPEPLKGLLAPSPMQFIANYQVQVLRAREVAGVDGRGPKEREKRARGSARPPGRIRQRKPAK